MPGVLSSVPVKDTKYVHCLRVLTNSSALCISRSTAQEAHTTVSSLSCQGHHLKILKWQEQLLAASEVSTDTNVTLQTRVIHVYTEVRRGL